MQSSAQHGMTIFAQTLLKVPNVHVMQPKAVSTVIRVPGSFELPLAAQFAFEKGFDAAVVLGVVIQGETPHFDYVCQGVTQGVMDVSLKFSKPIGFGVLTVNTIEQAIAGIRCGRPESFEDKGFDSTVAAIALLLQK